MATPRTAAPLYRVLLFAPALQLLIGAWGPLGVPSTLRYGAWGLVTTGSLAAAWVLGREALRSDDLVRRAAAAAGLLLILVLGALGLFAVLGPPQFSTHAENQLRYPLILSAALLLGGAGVLLSRALGAAGERFHSVLGLAAVLLAAPLYAVFAAAQIVEYRWLAASGAEAWTPEIAMLDALSIVLLFFGTFLMHLAGAAYARSFVRAGWLGSRAGRVLAGLAVFAAAGVAARTVEALSSPEHALWGFESWWGAPGFILAIPALPWLIPCLLGATALRRAHAETA